MTHTEHHWIDAPSLGGAGEVIVHGHWGRPVLWFPSEAGSAGDFEANGMLDAVRGAVDDGLIKIFCVSSYDNESLSARWKPQHDRALAHHAYEDWIIWRVVPFIRDHSGGRGDVVTAGPSMGAYHAILFALRHAHVFSRAIGFSGAYNPWAWHGWGEGTAATYAIDPSDFLQHVDGEHLDFLRRTLQLTLVVGSGSWEDSTGANASTRQLAGILAAKQIPHELHVWGHEWPHDWSSWRAQAALYLPQLGS